MGKTCRMKSGEKVQTKREAYNRVGKTATAVVATAAIKAYILRKILYAKSKVERKSLWLKCLGKNCDILMKLLMLFSLVFYSRFFSFIFSYVVMYACRWLFETTFIFFIFLSLPTRPPYIPC